VTNPPAPPAVTHLLRAWSDGDETALERLLPLYLSNDTIKRDWRLAKLWLLRELEGDAVERR
jgi:hypothetical protein